MNQILYIDGKKKSKGGPLEISTVVRIFAILIIIFGIIIAGQAVFAIASRGQESKEESIPSLLIEQNGATITLKIKHDKAIDKLIYSWNNGAETVLQGRGRNIIEESISATVGNNILKVRIIDIFGKESTYSKEIEVQSLDVVEPQIELLVEAAKVKISVKDETALDYISYRWNNEDETVVKAREESPKLIEERVDILKGENTLKIIAIDKAGNRTEKEQKYRGSTKPVIEVVQEGNTVKVRVTHEQNIQKIEYNINGTLYSTDAAETGVALGVKEYTYNFPLQQGQNTINVKAYNTDNLYEEVTQTIAL